MTTSSSHDTRHDQGDPDLGTDPDTDLEVDVVVVGGGAAGLAAAVALGRSRRSVALVDAGRPRNAPADAAHNVLGHEGAPPERITARGRAEAVGYGVVLVDGQVTGAAGVVDDFTVEVDDGRRRVRARRVVLATGLVDQLPDVEGLEAAWGHTVLHCPFCHGWEVRDQRIAVLSGPTVAMHQVVLFRQLSDDVTLFVHDAADPSDEQWEQLAALGVRVVAPRVERVVVDGTQVRAVEVAGGRSFAVDAVVVAPRFVTDSTLFELLGGRRTVTEFGEHVAADPRGATDLPGVWAAGNATQPMAMIAAAAAAGVMTGAAVHGDLAAADLARAVAVRRQPFSVAQEARNTETVLGERRHGWAPAAG